MLRYMPQQYKGGRARVGSINVWKGLALTFIALFVLMLIILAITYYSLQSSIDYWQSKYTFIELMYSNLENQLSQSHQLQMLLTSIMSCDKSGPLNAGSFEYCYVFVPSGYTGVLYITVSSSAPVEIYVLDPFQFACFWMGSCPYHYEYYAIGTRIINATTLSSGEYIVIVKNINNYPALVSISTSTTYIQSGQ